MSERHLTRTAVFVLLERDNKIFFLRRANTGWGDGLLTMPAGHVDKGDTPREAAAKESKEEAGIDVQLDDLEFVHADFIRDKYCNYYFRAKKWTGEPMLGEPHLSSEFLWIDKDHLPEDLTPQLKNLFSQLKNHSHYSELDDNSA